MIKLLPVYYYIFAMKNTSSILTKCIFEDNFDLALEGFKNFKKKYAENGYKIILSDPNGKILKEFSLEILL